ncbi:MAG: LysM peptidoglycan-binding domain-containing protein, partial [Proteobacteria bacterium]|nr:LysM peptidoglycan-binding domain-containing protein [Pseudomonadota bacterium]
LPEPGAPVAEPGTTTDQAPAGAGVAAGPVRPDFDVVRVDEAGNVVIAGRATPGCTIIIRDGETEVGRTTVDRAGEWVLVPDDALTPGARELTLVAECEGAEPLTADRVVALIVPERSGNALAVALPRDGEVEVLQRPGPAAAVGKIDYDEAGRTTLSGIAAPNSTVRIYLDNKLVGTTQADGDGAWTLTLDREIPVGSYTLRVDQVHPDGTVLARSELPFVRGERVADLPPGRVAIIQPGDHLWKIARQRYGSGFQFTLIYEANKDQIRDPDLIYPGQIFTLPAAN